MSRYEKVKKLLEGLVVHRISLPQPAYRRNRGGADSIGSGWLAELIVFWRDGSQLTTTATFNADT